MPIDILEQLGNKLKQARKKLGLTQDKLAEKTNISTRCIAKIEKGKMNPSFETLYYIVKELQIPTDSLFDINMSEEEENRSRWLYLYDSCSTEDRELLLKVMECLCNELKK